MLLDILMQRRLVNRLGNFAFPFLHEQLFLCTSIQVCGLEVLQTLWCALLVVDLGAKSSEISGNEYFHYIASQSLGGVTKVVSDYITIWSWALASHPILCFFIVLFCMLQSVWCTQRTSAVAQYWHATSWLTLGSPLAISHSCWHPRCLVSKWCVGVTGTGSRSQLECTLIILLSLCLHACLGRELNFHSFLNEVCFLFSVSTCLHVSIPGRHQGDSTLLCGLGAACPSGALCLSCHTNIMTNEGR